MDAALTLSHIECFFPDDYAGDEVYITANGSRIWGPVAMDVGDIRRVDRRIPFVSGPLVLRVFDAEPWPLADDEIGSVTVPAPQSEEEIRRAPSSATLSSSGGYRLFFSVHRT